MAERRLGRGLGSLLGTATQEEASSSVQEVAIDRIVPNPLQPRKNFDPDALEDLQRSIVNHGVLQPVVLRDVGDRFELIAGERRWRAATAAGLGTIPAVLRRGVSDSEMLELALVENVQRQDLDAIERARGYRDLMQALGLTQDEVATRVGLKRATVANHLRLLDLPEKAQQAIVAGRIHMGHARALLSLSSDQEILAMMDRIVRSDLSVREVEGEIRDKRVGRDPETAPAAEAPPRAPQEPWAKDLESRMQEHLGTKVQLQNSTGYKGRIVIEYFGREDLDRLAALLAPRGEL